MTKLNRKQLVCWLLFIFVLCVARSISKLEVPNVAPIPTILGSIQTLLYVGLIAFWSGSVRRRIVQPQIRVILECVSGLMMFWHLTRGVKYHVVAWFVGTGSTMRYLWYLYYLPMLLIPAFLIMIAFSLRKSESYRLPKKAVIVLLSVSAVLFLCVITNDLHQMVFDFPADAVVYTDGEYTRGALYYLCFAWIGGGTLTFLAMILRSCRMPNKKLLWIPFIPIAFYIPYSVIYILGNGVWFVMDFTTTFTFSLIAILEASIAVGLIPANTHYAELLRASDISAMITDKAYAVICASNGAAIPDRSVLTQAVENGSVAENGVRVSACQISGGYVFWQDDIAELIAVNAELSELREELRERYSVAQEAYQTSRRRRTLEEKNRIYNIMQTETFGKVNTLAALTEGLAASEDERELRRLTAECALLCAYLKRRNNLLFIKEGSAVIQGVELTYCLRESLNAFSYGGASVELRADPPVVMSFTCITRLYDAFETAAETVLHSAREVFVALTHTEGTVRLCIHLVCAADLFQLTEAGFAVDRDGDNEWVLEYTAEKGGERA